VKSLSFRTMFALICALALLVSACGDGGTGGAPDPGQQDGEATGTDARGEPLDLTLGGSATTSGVYAFLLAHARMAGQNDGALTINIRESTTEENIPLVSEGSVDFAIAGLDAVHRGLEGTGQFEGTAFDDVRLLMTYLTVAEMLVVRSDRGIESVYDLHGQPFAPSFQGSPVYTKVLEMLAVLGIEPDVFDGSLEDVVNAMKDGRIVGFGKAGAGLVADASMLDVASAVPVTLVGFSQDDIDEIVAEYPLYRFVEVPAGALLDSPAVLQSSIDAVYFTSERMDEETAYRLTRTLWETIEDSAQETGYQAAMGITPDMTAEAESLVPLHPGARRFWEEMGAL
jgi:uncharacterized protein